MKSRMLDKFFQWVDGDKSVLVSLAMIPLSIHVAFVILNSELGRTFYLLGGLILDSYLEIFFFSSICWAAATFFLLDALRVKSNWLVFLACATTFVAAMYFYLFF